MGVDGSRQRSRRANKDNQRGRGWSVWSRTGWPVSEGRNGECLIVIVVVIIVVAVIAVIATIIVAIVVAGIVVASSLSPSSSPATLIPIAIVLPPSPFLSHAPIPS